MRQNRSRLDIDWTNKEAVIRLADSFIGDHTVYKHRDRPNYNITHTTRTDIWLGHEVIHRTSGTVPSKD